MIIAWPSNTRAVIEEIINEIGRPVIFYTAQLSGCWLCDLDPITNTSVDSFCPVCSGTYWIATYSGYTITAHVTWKYSDKSDWQTGGIVPIGDGIIKVMYSGPYMEAINSADYAVVDGKEVNIERITLLGVPTVNRVILDFKERNG